MSDSKDFNASARAPHAKATAPALPARAVAGGMTNPSQSTAISPMSASAEGAALRLEKRTYLDGGKYRIILSDYGNGLGEIGWSFIPVVRPSQAGKGKSEAREANENRAVRRARSRMRRLILSAKANHLLTLTYRDNVTDFKRSCNDFSKFVRKVKDKLPGWVYIAVAENQKRGAWHWHIAVKGRQDVSLLRTTWREIVGEGNIDVNPPKSRDHNPELALVKYLSKYLGKGFKDGNHELNARRFRASHGIHVPYTMLELPENRRDDASGYAVEMLKANIGSVGYIWTGDDLSAGWACSWK